ncbi:MAG: potassium/proton antiporter [Dokdonella sp.]|uniref:potassium/proton antiporter n=1 Tax=Dokdonella sp. TaxID=2291710 RepID=UPI0025BCC26F|nr:potassium/proton antiporter [Dokdonella sp.]MBX3701883.1 potassium/proton antiporter [Dokdonella sp.]MCW5578629.1 potassium/proton antiporter [Dokdonella sp.]
MTTIEHVYWVFAAAAALVLVGIASSLVARRFSAPLLLVFLVIGMLAGADGPGGIAFDDYSGAYELGSLALAVILFDGGLRTRLETVRRVLAPTLLLATVGVMLSAVLTGMAASWLLHLEPAYGFLVGAVVASTDAAAVLFLLRAGGLQLRERVGATLEIESSANDPAAILLTMMLVEYVTTPAGLSPLALLREFVVQFGIGSIAGVVGGGAIARGLNHLQFGHALAALFALAGAVLVFGITGQLGGSGFLAVYIAGLVVANRVRGGLSNLLGTLDAATWLCQIAMFLVLGLLASPRALLTWLLPALGVAAFLMFVGRPLAVIACLAPLRRYGKREIAFISWIGLRGAVGIFLASIPMLAQLPNAQLVFNVAFVVVLVSLLVQGWTLGLAARLFDVALPHLESTVRRVELDLPGSLERELVGYPVAAQARVLAGAPLPSWSHLTLVVRDGAILAAHEAGALQIGDYAYLLAPPGRVYRLDWLFAPPEQAREAERELFGEFTFDADVQLGEIAEFYALPVRPRDASLTLAEHFARRFEHTIEVGDRVHLGAVTLIARDLDDEGVRKVGLKVDRLGTVLARPRWLQQLLPPGRRR